MTEALQASEEKGPIAMPGKMKREREKGKKKKKKFGQQYQWLQKHNTPAPMLLVVSRITMTP